MPILYLFIYIKNWKQIDLAFFRVVYGVRKPCPTKNSAWKYPSLSGLSGSFSWVCMCIMYLLIPLGVKWHKCKNDTFIPAVFFFSGDSIKHKCNLKAHAIFRAIDLTVAEGQSRDCGYKIHDLEMESNSLEWHGKYQVCWQDSIERHQ